MKRFTLIDPLPLVTPLACECGALILQISQGADLFLQEGEGGPIFGIYWVCDRCLKTGCYRPENKNFQVRIMPCEVYFH